jgi:hypothetical protein
VDALTAPWLESTTLPHLSLPLKRFLHTAELRPSLHATRRRMAMAQSGVTSRLLSSTVLMSMLLVVTATVELTSTKDPVYLLMSEEESKKFGCTSHFIRAELMNPNLLASTLNLQNLSGPLFLELLELELLRNGTSRMLLVEKPNS